MRETREGFPAREVFSAVSRQGRGMFHPPPRQPLPRGGDSPSIRCHGRGPLCRQCEHPAEILFLLPVHGIRVNRHALPAPSGGGGRRPRSGRVVGVICLTRKRSVWLRRRRQAVGVIIHLHGATGLLRQRTFPGEVLERWDGGARRPLAHIPPRLTDSVSSCRRAPSRS